MGSQCPFFFFFSLLPKHFRCSGHSYTMVLIVTRHTNLHGIQTLSLFVPRTWCKRWKEAISLETEWYVTEEDVRVTVWARRALSSRSLITALPLCPVTNLWVCVLVTCVSCYNAGLKAEATFFPLVECCW